MHKLLALCRQRDEAINQVRHLYGIDSDNWSEEDQVRYEELRRSLKKIEEDIRETEKQIRY